MEESKKPAAATSDDKDVSLNTMLDDSSLSFNPDAAAAAESQIQPEQPQAKPVIAEGPSMTRAQKPSKKELSQLKDLTDKLSDAVMRLTEMETEYEHYRTKTQTEMIELRDLKETAEAKLVAYSGYDDLVA